MKRLLSPSTNMTGLTAAAGAIYAAVLMIVHVMNHQAAFSAPVAIAGLAAAVAIYTRFTVTPVKDPKDGNGQPLAVAVPAVPSGVKMVSEHGPELVNLPPATAPVTPPVTPPAM